MRVVIWLVPNPKPPPVSAMLNLIGRFLAWDDLYRRVLLYSTVKILLRATVVRKELIFALVKSYFQAARGDSALLSGVYVLPYVIVLSLVSALTGISIAKTGIIRV